MHFLAIATSAAWCAAAAPAAALPARPIAVPLDGAWDAVPAFRQPAREPGADAPWAAVRLPGRWHRHGQDVQGAVWYRRRAVVPATAPGARAWLELDGADYFTDAWVDGRHVGFHEGGSAPFRFPLGALAPGPHAVALRVDSPYEPVGGVWSLRKRLLRGVANHHDARPGGAWDVAGQDANSGGVWGATRLRLTGPAAIAQVLPTPRLGPGTAALDLRVALDHAGAAGPAALVARLVPLTFQGPAQTWRRPIALAPGRHEAAVSLPVAAPRRWSTWDRGRPDLYRLELALEVGGARSDAWSGAVGLREVRRAADGTWTLNGDRLFLRGTNYISSAWPGDDQARTLRADVALMRAANVNAVRVHAHVEPRAFYDACDRAGLLVWQDLPLQWGYRDDAATHAAAAALAREVVAGYGHHASVFAWCGHNEAPYDADWMKWKYPDYDPGQNRALDDLLLATLRAADPGRYAHANSRTGEHPWLGWYSGEYRDYTAKPLTEPLVTEFGAQALPDLGTLRAFLPAAVLPPRDDAGWKLWGYHNYQREEAGKRVAPDADLPRWIGASQDYQARSIGFTAAALRRAKYAPVGAAFQFQFVEPWASIGWGAVDHLRRPKAGYRALREGFQPTLPCVVAEADAFPAGRARAFPLAVVHDPTKPEPGASVRWALRDAADRTLAEGTLRADLPSDGVVQVGMAEIRPLPPGRYRLDMAVAAADGRPLGLAGFRFRMEDAR